MTTAVVEFVSQITLLDSGKILAVGFVLCIGFDCGTVCGSSVDFFFNEIILLSLTTIGVSFWVVVDSSIDFLSLKINF